MSDAEPAHIPVLLHEVVSHLGVRPGARVVDATINGGGHAAALLEQVGPLGKVLGIDRDPLLIAAAQRRFADPIRSGCLALAAGSFADLTDLAIAAGVPRADAILADLGLSSFHLEQAGRGFSFQRDEPLDMRFAGAAEEGESAADLLATRTAAELAEIIRDYGEERFASRIARAVVAARTRAPVATAAQLFELIAQVLPGRERARAGRSAARVFQALRVVVNRELDAIQAFLPQAVEMLSPGGRLAVIAFHSLEDRIVKHFLVDARRAGKMSVLTKRPIRPTDAEILANPRASSAKLRVAEKL